MECKYTSLRIGYTWESTGRKPWVKGFPALGFDIENLKRELWVASADGIEVSLVKEQEIELTRYYVDGGEWKERVERGG